jgi:hypothetical protein
MFPTQHSVVTKPCLHLDPPALARHGQRRGESSIPDRHTRVGTAPLGCPAEQSSAKFFACSGNAPAPASPAQKPRSLSGHAPTQIGKPNRIPCLSSKKQLALSNSLLTKPINFPFKIEKAAQLDKIQVAMFCTLQSAAITAASATHTDATRKSLSQKNLPLTPFSSRIYKSTPGSKQPNSFTFSNLAKNYFVFSAHQIIRRIFALRLTLCA